MNSRSVSCSSHRLKMNMSFVQEFSMRSVFSHLPSSRIRAEHLRRAEQRTQSDSYFFP
jgi:hypothetical protein